MGREVAIVGVYEAPWRSAPQTHPYAMHAEAVHGALADAGLGMKDVAGFCTAAGDWGEGGAACDLLEVADSLGIRARYVESTDLGGASYIAHAGHAWSAIASGRVDVVVISYAACPRWWPLPLTFWDGLTLPAGPGQFELPFSPTIIGTSSLLATRHMHDFNTRPEHLAEIAVVCRRHAALNPHARYRAPLTVDEVLASPMIASPLRKLDCCVVTDGAGAVVLASADVARSCQSKPAWLLGFGEAVDNLALSSIGDRMTTPAARSGADAFAMAGFGPDRVQAAQLYDAFTLTVLLLLEDLGFCAKGEAGALIDSGALAPGGALAINTDGGGLSSNHPGRRGMFAMIEAARQVRGDSPGRQVPDCRVALAQGYGGNLSAATTLIVGS